MGNWRGMLKDLMNLPAARMDPGEIVLIEKLSARSVDSRWEPDLKERTELAKIWEPFFGQAR